VPAACCCCRCCCYCCSCCCIGAYGWGHDMIDSIPGYTQAKS
jgi:hypothetical protein